MKRNFVLFLLFQVIFLRICYNIGKLCILSLFNKKDIEINYEQAISSMNRLQVLKEEYIVNVSIEKYSLSNIK